MQKGENADGETGGTQTRASKSPACLDVQEAQTVKNLHAIWET